MRTDYSYDLANQLLNLNNHIATSGGSHQPPNIEESSLKNEGNVFGLRNPYRFWAAFFGKKDVTLTQLRNGPPNPNPQTDWPLISNLFNPKDVQAQTLPLLNSQYAYTYDPAGNRLTMTAPNGIHNYTYNNIYELTNVTGAQTHAFNYDTLGNRTTADSVNYTANNLNQYTQVSVNPYKYDGNGNLIDDNHSTYTYDAENRMTISTTQPYTSYQYDGLGRRIQKNIDGDRITYYVYDGDRIIEERSDNGGLLASYVYGDGIDEVLTMNRNNETFYYFYDGLGSVTDITNDNGQVVENYSYDVYGAPNHASSIGNPYMFTGRQYDDESGLYFYRARVYSPSLGRFLQRDPVGYYDSMNLFQYTLNNPTNFIDPLGLDVYLAGHVVLGVGGHAAIILIPDNENDFRNDSRFTRNSATGKLEADVSAGPKNGKLTQYAYNIDRSTNPGMKLALLTDPRGRSDSQFIRDILSSSKQYNNQLSYDPFALGSAYNSNSYVRGILENAGVGFAELPGSYWYPGWDKPIPLKNECTK